MLSIASLYLDTLSDDDDITAFVLVCGRQSDAPIFKKFADFFYCFFRSVVGLAHMAQDNML